MSVYLSLALGLVQIVGWLTRFVDDVGRQRLARAMVENEEIGRDVQAAATIVASVATVAAEIGHDHAKITAPDKDMRR